MGKIILRLDRVMADRKISLNELKRREYQFEIKKMNDYLIQYSNYHYDDNFVDVNAQNVNEGKFLFNIFVGKKKTCINKKIFIKMDI